MRWLFPLTILLLGGIGIRSIHLDQSLWLDEATSLRVVTTYTLPHIITGFSIHDFHPPGYYFILSMWTSLWGTSVIAARSLSITAWIGATIGIYALANRIDPRMGRWAALWYISNPLLIYYSQEARMYLIVVAVLTWYTYMLQRSHEHLRWRIGAAFCAALAMGVFYGSALYIGAWTIYFVIKKDARRALTACIGAVIMLFCLAPLISTQLTHAQLQTAQIIGWRAVLGLPQFKNLALIFVKFMTGRISFDPKIWYFALAGVSLCIYMYGIVRNGTSRVLAYANIFFLTLLIGVMISYIFPLLQYFRFLYLSIPLALIYAAAAVTRPRWGYIVGTVFIIWSCAYLFVPAQHREDWKTATTDLPPYAHVMLIGTFADPINYYRPDIQVHDLTQVKGISEDMLYVFPYGAEIFGISPEKILTAQGYTQKSAKSYRGIVVQKWVR